jgi:hypothetical protein
MIDLSTMTIGTDAELPIQLLDGSWIPVTGLVGGTKDEPIPLGKLGPGFFVQEDCTNLEFNVPACQSGGKLELAVAKALKEIRNILPPTMTAKIESLVEYNPKFLQIPQTRVFGCMPDFNVYTKEENPRPSAKNPNVRTAAAHVHLGWANPTNEDRFAFVKMLDLFMALAFVAHDNAKRRELYGRAGSFRPKEYGLEYRVLGNSWLNGYIPVIWDFARMAAGAVNSKVALSPEEEKTVINCINTGKINDAGLSVGSKYGVYFV